MIKLLPEERQSVAQYIHSICAITLDHSKDYLIESRLAGVMTETGSTSFTQLLSRARVFEMQGFCSHINKSQIPNLKSKIITIGSARS